MNKDNSEGVFSVKPKKAQDKAEITNSVARAIVKEETDARIAQTSALRAARLALEAAKPAPVKPKRRVVSKPRFRTV